MMDLDDIKAGWNAMALENLDLKNKNLELTRKLATQKIIGSQQRLARNMRIGYLGFFFPVFAYFLYTVTNTSLTLCIVYSLDGWILGAFDIWFGHYIMKTDYTALPTVKALDQALRILRYYYIATAISIIFCLSILIPLFYEMATLEGHEVLYGGILGGIIGGYIGWRKWMQNRKLARQIIDELRSIRE